MTDRPILFTAPNARLIMDGIKSQTRRLATSPLQHVKTGDRLYLREPWRADDLNDNVKPSDLRCGCELFYEADWVGKPGRPEGAGRLRPGMFLPRAFTRATLVVGDVRTEFLRDISEADAKAEGIAPASYTDKNPYTAAYRDLWNQLHPKDLWHTNPKIIALTFRCVRENIDRLTKEAA